MSSNKTRSVERQFKRLMKGSYLSMHNRIFDVSQCSTVLYIFLPATSIFIHTYFYIFAQHIYAEPHRDPTAQGMGGVLRQLGNVVQCRHERGAYCSTCDCVRKGRDSILRSSTVAPLYPLCLPPPLNIGPTLTTALHSIRNSEELTEHGATQDM